MLLHLNLDSMIETLDCLQVERAFVEKLCDDIDDIDDERGEALRARINRIHKACETLTDKLIEAVDELKLEGG